MFCFSQFRPRDALTGICLCLLISYACICTWMHEHGTTLKRNNYLGNITRSAMGKQNVQAKKVCYLVSPSNLATMGTWRLQIRSATDKGSEEGISEYHKHSCDLGRQKIDTSSVPAERKPLIGQLRIIRTHA